MAQKEIGGYFELELPAYRNNVLNSGNIFVNSGAHGFRLLLRHLRPVQVWLPDYTCDVMNKAAEAEGVKVRSYCIDRRLEISEMPDFDPERELVVVNDYFGVKDSYINEIVRKYPRGIVADCAQALMCKLPPEVPAIRSPRKFVGIPDGGMVNIPGLSADLPGGSSRHRCKSLLTRLEAPASEGYAAFKKASADIHDEDITDMSALTRRLLQSIDFEYIANKRRQNFRRLSEALAEKNLLTPFIDPYPEMPMVYPYMTEDESLRSRLIENKIYVARYWPLNPETLPEGSIVKEISGQIVPLPIDQRYGEEEMQRILALI